MQGGLLNAFERNVVPEMISVEQARDLVSIARFAAACGNGAGFERGGRVAATDLQSDIDIAVCPLCYGRFAVRWRNWEVPAPETPLSWIIAEVAIDIRQRKNPRRRVRAHRDRRRCLPQPIPW